MSRSDSNNSSHASVDYKNFRQVSRERLLHEMLGMAKQWNSQSTWKVLIMDRFTVKIMSYTCKMADIIEAGVSLVEDIYKRRQPLPNMDAIYFLQPTKENVIMFMSDMAGKSPLYKKAFVFFSSPISGELVAHIKKDATVLPRLGVLSEMNLEYFAIDSQGFVTGNERALEELFGDDENHWKAEACLHVMATRIATAFASMRELPFVRYCAAKSLDPATVTTYRDLLPTKLAAYIWNSLTKYKATIANFPQTETCELLVVDRSVDPIAPLIHEWTYDAMCHDLLNLEGNKYVHEVPSKRGGPPKKTEVLLEEHDSIWQELRHLHIADVYKRLDEKLTNFKSKNKAAQIHGSRKICDLPESELQKIAHALPEYVEQKTMFSLHAEIADNIGRIIREQGLKDVGQLEQDLVFGDAGTKDVVNFLSTHEDVSRENKLRLLIVYAGVHPENFEGEKGSKLMQLARLSSDDMDAIKNMRLLAAPSEAKKSSIGGFALNFDKKKRHGVRKERSGEETQWQLSRFYPRIEELVEKLSKGELPKDEYPCMNEPSPTIHETTHPAVVQYPFAQSMRSRRTPTWARPRHANDGCSSNLVLRHASSDFRKMGRRIFVFIVGGATRSELRACHELTRKLKREVILGSSSIDDPAQFITELVEKLSKGELRKDEYPCMNEPSPTIHETTHPAAIQYPVAKSMRSRRTPTWAWPRYSNDGYSSNSVLRHASSNFRKMGRRIFVFIVGGATRSDLRACHELNRKLGREVILGSSSIDDPAQFITGNLALEYSYGTQQSTRMDSSSWVRTLLLTPLEILKLLSASELSLDDLEM